MRLPIAPIAIVLAIVAALCLLLAGCDQTRSLKVRDTAKLGTRIQSAADGVQEAKRSTAAISGNVGRARTASSRIEGKSVLVLKWIEAQP